MSGHYVLGEDGRTPVPASMMDWARSFRKDNDEAPGPRPGASWARVAHDDLPSAHVSVSTVFLGLDHRFGPGAPLTFETMVFGGSLDQEQERYSTWDEAEAGHAAMVERVKAAALSASLHGQQQA